MQTRMFKYPCSYLIYSSTFVNLEPELLNQVCVQLRQVLEGKTVSLEYAHLTPGLRQEILEILGDTHNEFKQ